MGVGSSAPVKKQVGRDLPRNQTIGAGIEDPAEYAHFLRSTLQRYGVKLVKNPGDAEEVEVVGGRRCKVCCCECGAYDDYAADAFGTKKIKVDGVEDVLAFARTGSEVPAVLHGVFWMDMFTQSSVAKDPRYGYSDRTWWLNLLGAKEGPASVFPDWETLICFGDKPMAWDEEAATLRNVGVVGEKGHWTYPDNALGWLQGEMSDLFRLSIDLEFQDSEMTSVHAPSRIRIPTTDVWIHFPKFLYEVMMHKTEWGWARRTTFANFTAMNVSQQFHEDLQTLVPASLMDTITNGKGGIQGRWWNYPMVQIVDGNGRRTKFYDEYLKFMKRWESDEQFVVALKED